MKMMKTMKRVQKMMMIRMIVSMKKVMLPAVAQRVSLGILTSKKKERK